MLFLTKYVCRSSVDFRGPIGERYAGLYYSFMERFRGEYDFYWYTGDGEAFDYEPESNSLQARHLFTTGQSRLSLVRLLLSFCVRNNKSQNFVVLSYPNFPKTLLVAALLLVLRPWRVTVVVDVQDLALPRETPWTMSYLVWWLVNELLYCYAHFVVNANECAKLYARRARGSIEVIPMAAHDKIFTPANSSERRKGLTLIYVGSLEHRRGFPRVIEVLKEVRSEGFDVNLIINGDKPDDLDLDAYPWVELHGKQPLISLAELLRSADVGIIPYLDSDYWGRMSITKMAMYMAAGLPVLTLRLTETANILTKWDCGVSANDWDDFAAAIKKLCEDKSWRARLGANARKAAVEEYNWEKQAERLGVFMGSLR